MQDEFTQKTPISRLILIIVSVVVLFTLGIYIGFDLGKSDVGTETISTITPEIIPVTQTTETTPPTLEKEADFKTYTNTEFGFSMEIPIDYTVLETQLYEGARGVNLKLGKIISESVSNFNYLQISFLDASITLDDMKKEYEKNPDIIETTNIKIDNQDAIQYKIGGFASGYDVVSSKGKYSVKFSLYPDDSESVIVLNQIVSSFKFPK